jgi:hypothetical protein
MFLYYLLLWMQAHNYFQVMQGIILLLIQINCKDLIIQLW